VVLLASSRRLDESGTQITSFFLGSPIILARKPRRFAGRVRLGRRTTLIDGQQSELLLTGKREARGLSALVRGFGVAM
jgi:hypothetical protein